MEVLTQAAQNSGNFLCTQYFGAQFNRSSTIYQEHWVLPKLVVSYGKAEMQTILGLQCFTCHTYRQQQLRKLGIIMFAI